MSRETAAQMIKFHRLVWCDGNFLSSSGVCTIRLDGQPQRRLAISYRLHVSCFAWLGLTISFCMPLEVLAVGSGAISHPAAPRSAEAEYNRGLEAKSAKRFSEAIADFRRAVDIRPDFPEAWNELGFALRQAGFSRGTAGVRLT
jgi:tetratricopeptide (TPR) repeat protein